MHITLKQLGLLRAIARHRSITKAAAEVGLSQPAVSMQLKQLEEELGGPLSETVNRRLHLTELGNAVLAAADDILQRLDRLEEELEASRGLVVGDLDIAVVTSAKHFLPYYLGEFLRLHPKVKPRLTVTNRIGIIEALKDNRHDLYIMGQIPERLQVEAAPILDNILEVVAAADHPLVGREAIPLSVVAEERFLVREAGSGTHIAIEKLFAGQGLVIKPFMELGSTGAIKSAVIAGLGIAVLSRHSLEFELKAGALAILDVEGFPLRRSWYAAYPSGKRLSVAARSFYDFLIEKTADYEEEEEGECAARRR
jgi:DNA-binding transcriptional LysR family regulator